MMAPIVGYHFSFPLVTNLSPVQTLLMSSYIPILSNQYITNMIPLFGDQFISFTKLSRRIKHKYPRYWK